MMSLINTYQQHGWQVTFASPAQLSPHRLDLTQQNIDEVSIKVNCSSCDKFVTDLKPDAVLFDRFMMEEQFGWRVEKHCPSAIRILDLEDLHFLRHARHQAHKKQHPLLPTDLHTELAVREIASIYRCDLTLVISRAEMDLLTRQFHVPDDILLYSPFMLDMQQLPTKEQLPVFEQRQHFISIGNFRHEPNWDAVLWLKQTIWPLIRKQLPHAELHIYGAYPPKKATDLHNAKQGFLVKGWAENAGEVMQNARVCLAPLRFGAGLKGKLLDAMTFGTPSVTTRIGAEGMSSPGNWAGIIAESPETIASAAVALYQDQQQWLAAQQTGFELLKQYDQQVHQKALMQCTDLIQQSLDQHRQENFYGMMLRHHSMKSTQYMAQWIEAKNK
ncbi:glycosyltransferase family 4 protein [Neptunicella marina]|uniref:Glycosyltransferase family 4 protein n=2 Tax=Neptunicella marina TaxID=2125989 RepID=A0A8J6IVM3_9ALTE|nr:glycosyltransferase family 4 protein [Neptunicella marina]